MRKLLFVALIACAAPAAAQTPDPDLARAAQHLAANWRQLQPAEGVSAEAMFQTACEGATEEMAALDAALPDAPSPEILAGIRAPLGFVIVPTGDTPAEAYIFPNAQLTEIASGLAAIRVVDASQGRVDIHDAAGRDTHLQLGVAGGKAVMRILRTQGAPLLYVGCASSIG